MRVGFFLLNAYLLLLLLSGFLWFLYEDFLIWAWWLTIFNPLSYPISSIIDCNPIGLFGSCDLQYYYGQSVVLIIFVVISNAIFVFLLGTLFGLIQRIILRWRYTSYNIDSATTSVRLDKRLPIMSGTLLLITILTYYYLSVGN